MRRYARVRRSRRTALGGELDLIRRTYTLARCVCWSTRCGQHPLAEQLPRCGHDLVAVVEQAELRHAPDPAVFEAARGERRAVFTENVSDSVPLANEYMREGSDFYGLVLTTNAGSPRGREETLDRAR